MPRITFSPSEISITAESGAELLDAAVKAGIAIPAPCGGRGSCGKCRITINSGSITSENGPVRSGEALACKCRVSDEDVSIFIIESDLGQNDHSEEPDDYSEKIKPAIDQGLSPLAERLVMEIPKPSMDDGLGDADRIARGLKATGREHINIPLSVTQNLPSVLRASDWSPSLELYDDPPISRIIRVKEKTASPRLGLAIDIGTTSVSAMLVDLTTGRILAVRSGYNDQINLGLDVISRIAYAKNDERKFELRKRALSTINRLARHALGQTGNSEESIVAAAVSGNTTMTNMLLGVDPSNIRLEPYAPGLLSVPIYSASEAGICGDKNAPVYFSPAAGSYVGGDISAGLLLAHNAMPDKSPYLFIDIGTNGEVAVAGDGFTLCAACSAGPAFEGGGISCGMRASAGAINSVSTNSAGMLEYQIIGGNVPKGICGSGMIELIVELYRAGLIDASGKLDRASADPRIAVLGRKALYLIYDGSRGGGPIAINETDIGNVIRAKAAIYAGSSLLAEQAGLKVSEIKRIFIAGGFGRHLSIEHAIALGLLPDLPRDRFNYIGNSSLTGSAMLLLSKYYRTLQKEIAASMTYINLSSEHAYMDSYTAALFIPHTDKNLFPNIR
jgi:uncharacterized 2Fe-2S/4Fe-4S cluster protein (DUF4445 family)